jgi:uncharacterized protein (DUF1778 family)
VTKPNDPSGDDLIGDMIAEVARARGMAICREDPIVAVVLLNQVVLRRYLEETVAPAAAAIRKATRDTIDQIEKVAEAQGHWLDQVSLKDRASFLEDQKALHEAWKADMQALIEGQNAALQQVVVQTVALLRNQPPAAGPVTAMPPAPLQAQASAPTGMGNPSAWIWAGMLLGTGATVVLTLAAVVGRAVAGQWEKECGPVAFVLNVSGRLPYVAAGGQPMPSAAPTARLEARISTELHAMLKRAAEIQGRSLTDFVMIAVQEAAQRAIEQGAVVRLSLADSERFAPGPPVPDGHVVGPGATLRASPQAGTTYLERTSHDLTLARAAPLETPTSPPSRDLPHPSRRCYVGPAPPRFGRPCGATFA